MSTRWTLKDVQLKLGQKAPVADNKNRKPNFPVKKTKSSEDSPANVLTREALRLLRIMGYTVWRQNRTGVWDPVKKIFRKSRSEPGLSDILGYHKKTGVIIAVEIKIPPDKLSDDQVNFLQGVRDAGGIGIVLRSGEDLERFYKSKQ